jgi:hypothetical protein
MRIGHVLAVTAVALLFPGAAVPLFHAAAPPVGHTGGFGEPTCLKCHTGDPVNAFGGSVRVEGFPKRYTPGRAYPLTVVLRADETAVAGFQLAARFIGGDGGEGGAGSLRTLDGRVAVTFDEHGQPYAHQTEAGAAVADPAGSSWTLEWVAPPGGGDVLLHVAANSGNGDNSPLGDLIYTAEVRAGGGVRRPPP